MDEEARWVTVPAIAFDDLLRHPFYCGMASYLDMHDLAVGVTDRKENIERLEPGRPHADEITGPDILRMPLGFPAYGRRTYFATVRPETLKPSPTSSAWILH